MATLSDLLTQTRYAVSHSAKLQQQRSDLLIQLESAKQEWQDLVDSQKVLSSISEENTQRTLEYITKVINKSLAEIFQGQGRQVELSRTLYRDRYAHITVVLRTANGGTRDLDLQTGQGVKEVISFLFTVCLIAVRGGRRLLIMDELLSGLHAEAKQAVSHMIGVFCEEGFQFVMVEYGLDKSPQDPDHSFGSIFNVEQVEGLSSAVSVTNGAYTPTRYQD